MTSAKRLNTYVTEVGVLRISPRLERMEDGSEVKSEPTIAGREELVVRNNVSRKAG